MRYGTIDIEVAALTKDLFGHQAEVTRAVELSEDGKMLKLLIKAQDDAMPQGATLSTMADLPHFVCEFTERRVAFISR